jgi:hypothetical protein
VVQQDAGPVCSALLVGGSGRLIPRLRRQPSAQPDHIRRPSQECEREANGGPEWETSNGGADTDKYGTKSYPNASASHPLLEVGSHAGILPPVSGAG